MQKKRMDAIKRVIDAPLIGHELEQAATILAQNFHQDEGLLWLIQSQEILDVGIISYFRFLLKDPALAKDLYLEDGQVSGVAISAPPNRVSDLAKLKDENLPFTDRDFQEIFSRVQFLTEFVEQQRHALIPYPTWRYLFIAVSPHLQGLGIGSQILQFSLDHSLKESIPIYVETSQKQNVSFYQKNGFNFLIEYAVPHQGPHYWAFLSKKSP